MSLATSVSVCWVTNPFLGFEHFVAQVDHELTLTNKWSDDDSKIIWSDDDDKKEREWRWARGRDDELVAAKIWCIALTLYELHNPHIIHLRSNQITRVSEREIRAAKKKTVFNNWIFFHTHPAPSRIQLRSLISFRVACRVSRSEERSELTC